jgi:2'-5' RNA ligase
MAPPGQLVIMARVMPVRRQVHGALAPLQLTRVIGHALFPSRNWHQSLSGWHPASRLEALRLACGQLEANAFCFHLDRFVSTGNEPGAIHWTLRSSHGDPLGFPELLAALQRALLANGIQDECGHTAHVTLSYFAQQSIANADIEPVDWVIDNIELVAACGHGDTYRYETIASWPLLPMVHALPTQLSLLAR